jgi:hypothetical protein
VVEGNVSAISPIELNVLEEAHLQQNLRMVWLDEEWVLPVPNGNGQKVIRHQ